MINNIGIGDEVYVYFEAGRVLLLKILKVPNEKNEFFICKSTKNESVYLIKHFAFMEKKH